MNLFWSTRSLTASREDHLTEFFAAALELSAAARQAYFDATLKDFSRINGWTQCSISRIETQPRKFTDTTCRPDMLLTLANGKRIACEHKLDSIETAGPKCDERGQLERYLDLPIDGLVFVRASWGPPSERVLRHPKYVRPIEREHFLWRDFYHLFNGSDERFLRWLRDGFQNLGFTPPHASVGDLEGPDEELVKKNKRNIAKLWTRTRSLARGFGWYVEPGGISELYLSDNSRALASMMWVAPRSASLLVRITPRKDGLQICSDRLAAAAATLPGAELNQVLVNRREGKVTVLDVTCSMSDVLGKSQTSAEEMEENLERFVGPLLVAVDGRCVEAALRNSGTANPLPCQ